ncbi:MAG: carbamoyltransferase HypF [Actinomycetes bacterium]
MPERRRLHVRGTVQGVGFRPFVYREAVSRGLTGWVRNDGSGVVVEVEGAAGEVQSLADAVEHRPPPLALVESVESRAVPPVGDRGFVIAATDRDGGTDVAVSADVAPCEACLAELADPNDRRYRYPFVNCTDCGPRYTIVTAVPYDRAATTMAGFDMCGACQEEYDDPAGRRFHAQPNACPACGPELHWQGDGVQLTGQAALDAAVCCLAAGGVVAVKGIGGYHLACDAADDGAVATLRGRKRRDDKPFAVLVGDVDAARELCVLDDAAAAALTSPRRPVVLAPRQPEAAIAPQVAPRLAELGVMLPSSPLHVLLLQALDRPLVMTSGNVSDEPVAHDDDDARQRLGPLVDGLLSHDRPIAVRADDSVARAAGGRVQVVRRARGHVPQPLRLPVPARDPVLAVGAQLKSTVTLVRGTAAVSSHHLGDLDHWAAYESFRSAIEHLQRLSGIAPAVVAHDLHPGYRSTAWAQEAGLPLVEVQHHHAHVASCLAEHGRTDPVVGVAFDGLGLGCDGTLWGGEVLVADLRRADRVAHLAPVPLPGGDAATREPWRMALSWLRAALGEETAAEWGATVDPRAEAVLALARSGRQPVTTSAGRLFDAVASLLGVRMAVTYEGQAAIELEALARGARGGPDHRFDVRGEVLDPSPVLAGLLADVRRGIPIPELALAFHRALAWVTAATAAGVASARGLDAVVLTGGVFSNALLTELVAGDLERRGLRVLLHGQVPPNDGGISLGQAAVAAAQQH